LIPTASYPEHAGSAKFNFKISMRCRKKKSVAGLFKIFVCTNGLLGKRKKKSERKTKNQRKSFH
jgi:hypothetical protein